MKSYERWILLLLILITLIPVWTFRYFPSQDGPLHLYNAYVLKNYSAPHYSFSSYYKINSLLLPNVLADLLLLILVNIFPVLLAEKVFLSLYVLLFTWGIIYFLNSINKKDNLFIIAPVFIYNLFLFFGFYNFLLSVPIFLFALGFWFRHSARAGPAGILLGNALAFVLYLSHLYSWAVYVVALLFIFLITEKFRGLLKSLLWIMPTLILFLLVFFINKLQSPDQTLFYSPIVNRFSMLLLPVFLRYFANIEIILAGSLLLFFVVGIIARRAEWLNDRQESLVLFVLLLTIIYFFCPYWYGAAGYINVRLPLFIFLLLTPVISLKPGSKLRVLSVMYLCVFTVVHVILIERMSTIYNKGITEFTSGLKWVKRNSVILSIVKDRHGPSRWIAPYSHAYCYYLLATNSINPYHNDGNIPATELAAIEKMSIMQLKENHRNLRQVKFKSSLIDQQNSLRNYDYILIWDKMPNILELENFQLIYKTEHLVLYKNKSKL